MADDVTLPELLARWFGTGDQSAYGRAFEWLAAVLQPPREVIDGLGSGEIDEIRQDVLARLLDRANGNLCDAQSPLAYARTVFRRDLTNALTKWDARGAREIEVSNHLHRLAPTPEVDRVDARLDAEAALDVASRLEGKGRLAVLLTTRPSLIQEDEWAELVKDHPPPRPKRPRTPLDREEASLLLYRPRGPETTKQRYQRLNSFDTTFKRATKAIHRALEVDE